MTQQKGNINKEIENTLNTLKKFKKLQVGKTQIHTIGKLYSNCQQQGKNFEFNRK